jgi:aerobic carbon-monoxide dehydrogenase medium subunit
MYETTYIRAGNLAQAQQLLRDNPEATLLAGGQTLVLTLKQRLARPSHVIDIAHLNELKGISAADDRLVIGAGTRHAEVATNAEVRRRIPGLAHLAEVIGDPAVRHMGTIGGSIANSDPAADYPAAALGLGATVHTSQRAIAADDFFTGLFETALQRGEIITRLAFPIPRRSGYAKFPQQASHFALVGVFVAQFADASVRVAITGAGPQASRASDIEAALRGNFTAAAAEQVRIGADGLNSDIHASPEYRAHLIPVLAARAVTAALHSAAG